MGEPEAAVVAECFHWGGYVSLGSVGGRKELTDAADEEGDEVPGSEPDHLGEVDYGEDGESCYEDYCCCVAGLVGGRPGLSVFGGFHFDRSFCREREREGST